MYYIHCVCIICIPHGNSQLVLHNIILRLHAKGLAAYQLTLTGDYLSPSILDTRIQIKHAVVMHLLAI